MSTPYLYMFMEGCIIIRKNLRVMFPQQEYAFPLYGVIQYLLLLAFCEPFVYFLGETYGIERVSPVVASLVISTIPVFTAIVLTIFFRTKLNRLNQIGILVSFVGIVLMILGKNMQLQVDMIGLLFLLIAVAASIGYGLILTKLSAQVHPIWLIAFQNTVGLILFLPLWSPRNFHPFLTVLV